MAGSCQKQQATPGHVDAQPSASPSGTPTSETMPNPDKKPLPPVAAERAPSASPRLPTNPDGLLQPIDTYFQGRVGHRLYVQVDKPLYQPGEAIWFRAWDLDAKKLAPREDAPFLTLELVNPKGSTVETKRVRLERGVATNDFQLGDDVDGGEYLLRAKTADGTVTEERPIIVNAYQAPRTKKKLEFLRKAYGPGDEVRATVEVKRPTGEALAAHPLRAQVTLDGAPLAVAPVTTDAAGAAIVKLTLPKQIERGDALLTVLVDDGGVTESVSKRIPIILAKVALGFFPEGGQMIEGLPTRVYFEAKDTIGKPADIEGRVVDDVGNPVAELRSHHDGLGRFEFTPSTGRKYAVEITRPVGVTERYPLPLALQEGVALRTYDDLDGQEKALRVGVRSTKKETLTVVAVLRDQRLDAATIEVEPNREAIVHLTPQDDALARAQGVARVTVFDADRRPRAERVVFRNRRASLGVKVTTDRPQYAPREQVAVTIETTDPSGAAVPAEVALSVVDDTVLAYADDKTGHLLTRVLFEQELGDKVEEPRPFFDLTEAKSALALELLMGTRGWRKFEWVPVFSPPPPAPVYRDADDGMAWGAAGGDEEGMGIGGLGQGKGGGGRPRGGRPMPAAAMPPPAPMPQAAPVAQAAPGGPPRAKQDLPNKDKAKAEAAKPRAPLAEPVARAAREQRAEADAVAGKVENKRARLADEAFEAEEAPPFAERARRRPAPIAFAPVRVFPAPVYRGDEPPTRSDFRETIHWAPSVTTGKSGRATVTFYLSDAVTSFRVVAEGAGGGALGRAEHVLKSALPFSLAVKLPVEVSAGDEIIAPVTLSNEQDRALDVELAAGFGELVTAKTPIGGKLTLAAKARQSAYHVLTVGDRPGQSKVFLAAKTAGLEDTFERELRVAPLGFPIEQSLSGTLSGRAAHTFDVGDLLPGTGELLVKLYPSPIATMTSGIDGLLREPYGCFEQTSSTNYPNVMVLDYLRSSDAAAPDVVGRATGLLEKGYGRLVGFETKERGYEWFGAAPAHEALTAYGLVQFVDMKRVVGGVDDAMIARTAKYLEGRRDGKGGYQRDGKALDSFGRASPEVTDAYITWALSEAKMLSAGPELARTAALAASTKDHYLLALAAGTLLNLPEKKAEGVAAARRLAAGQDKSGAWLVADHSITRSTGHNLTVETTALALLALMKADGFDDAVRGGVEWLNNHRGGFGEWGATQATVLTLRALSTYAMKARRIPTAGDLEVVVNGQPAGRAHFEAGAKDAIVVSGLGRFLKPGTNTLELVLTGADKLPYSVAIGYRSVKPGSAPDAVVGLETRLDRTSAAMGETVRLTAEITNRTQSGQPMTMARLGLPGGLKEQTWQLKELREKGVVAFWETRPREVILYFRELAPGEKKIVNVDLVAEVPGTYTGPASSAYLYYTNDKKTWVDPVKVSIRQP